MRLSTAIATAAAALAFAVAAPAGAGADPTDNLKGHLERVLADASPALTACGTTVGLPPPAPAVSIRLLFTGGKVKVELSGMETVVKAKRKALEKCLRAAVAAQTVAKAAIDFRPLQVDIVTPPVPVPPYDPVAAKACTTTSDCTIICQVANSCCGGQCGCSNAVNTSQVAAVQASAAAACKTATSRCPAVGCALEQFHAECVQGKCVSRRGGGMGF